MPLALAGTTPTGKVSFMITRPAVAPNWLTLLTRIV